MDQLLGEKSYANISTSVSIVADFKVGDIK
jgi:hypothetical protein